MMTIAAYYDIIGVVINNENAMEFMNTVWVILCAALAMYLFVVRPTIALFKEDYHKKNKQKVHALEESKLSDAIDQLILRLQNHGGKSNIQGKGFFFKEDNETFEPRSIITIQILNKYYESLFSNEEIFEIVISGTKHNVKIISVFLSSNMLCSDKIVVKDVASGEQIELDSRELSVKM